MLTRQDAVKFGRAGEHCSRRQRTTQAKSILPNKTNIAPMQQMKRPRVLRPYPHTHPTMETTMLQPSI